MSKEAIIDKILSDAESEKQIAVGTAEESAAKSKAAVTAEVEAFFKRETAKAAAMAPELLRRRLSVAELENKKLALAAKQQVLKAVFDRATDSILALPKDEYLGLIRNMLLNAAEDGDEVTVGSEGLISKTFVQETAAAKGIKLIYKGVGDFKGGVILSGNGCDKNMSLAVELSALREELEPLIAEMLFKE